MIASPENSEAPRMPKIEMKAAQRPNALRASAVKASVPPSPLLSARIRNRTYLTVTVSNNAQSRSETMPMTSPSVAPAEFRWASDSRNA